LSNQFSAKILVCITTALEKYGAAVSQVLIWNFENDTKLKASDIARKPQEFVDCIQRIFGPSASAIERSITEEVCKEFKLDSAGIPGFVNAVEIARSNALKEELTD
jgi:hypothetical protein